MRRLIAAAILIAALGLLYWLFGDRIAIPSEAQIETWLRALGIWGPIAIIALRCAAALMAVVPSSVVVIAAGAAYGVAAGTLYVLIGAELGALIAFYIGRWLGKDFVARQGWLETLQGTKVGGWMLSGDAGQRRLMLAVLYARLLPGLNLDGMSYVAGITELSLWRFLLGTFGGLLPYTLLLTLFGHGLTEMSSTQLLLAAVAIVLLIAITFGVQWARSRSASRIASPEE